MTMVNRELDNIDASRALSKMEIKILDELRPKKNWEKTPVRLYYLSQNGDPSPNKYSYMERSSKIN